MGGNAAPRGSQTPCTTRTGKGRPLTAWVPKGGTPGWGRSVGPGRSPGFGSPCRRIRIPRRRGLQILTVSPPWTASFARNHHHTLLWRSRCTAYMRRTVGCTLYSVRSYTVGCTCRNVHCIALRECTYATQYIPPLRDERCTGNTVHERAAVGVMRYKRTQVSATIDKYTHVVTSMLHLIVNVCVHS